MKTKTLDCMDMKRRSAARIHEEVKDFTFEQKVAYREEKNQAFREKIRPHSFEEIHERKD